MKYDISGFQYIINFEYVAIAVMVIVLVYMVINKMFILKRSKLFTFIIIMSIVFNIFNIFKSSIINSLITSGDYNQTLLALANIFQTLHLLTFFLATFLFVCYVVIISCGTDFTRKKIWRLLLLMAPIIIAIGIIISNFFINTGLMYEVDSGKLVININLVFMIILGVIILLYFVATSILVHKFRNIFERKQIWTLFSILPLVSIGIIVESIVPSLLILSFIISIAIIIVQVILESTEDLIDSNTNLYNESEFIKSIKKIYIGSIDKLVVLIKTTNYSELVKTYDVNEVNKFNFTVTDCLNKVRKKRKITDELYSLGNGYYASIMDEGIFIAEDNNYFLEAINLETASIDFKPMIERCILKLRDDFESSDDVVNFVNNFRQSISFNTPLTFYGDVKNDKTLIVANHLEQIIDVGLKENEFVVYYQPIYSTKYKKFKTAEALVRLNSKKYGFISPGSFIPYAERTGRIADIDSFVMEEVFKFVSGSIFSVLGLDYIEINLSMAECVDPKLVDRISDLLEKYNVDPKNVNLEITESFDASEQELINNNLNKLVEMGFELSLDDYGTGYSNINRFSSLPISIVKIDKSLVDESEDENIKKILNYSFNIVKDLKKQTVVEGVETKEQLDRFIAFGADYIQGYYFSKPLDFEKYIDFIQEKNE